MKESRPTIEQLVWDDWNLEHIRKHDVTPSEVEEVVGPQALYWESYKSRLVMMGPVASGHLLVVVIGSSPTIPNHWYVFSARPASRKERERYQADMFGESQ